MPSPRLSCCYALLAVGSLVLIATTCAFAQDDPHSSMRIDQLRDEIHNLEGRSCDPSTSALLRDEFERLSDTRKDELSTLLKEQISELKTGPSTAGVALTLEDENTIASLVAPFERELESLQRKSGCDDSGAEPATSASASHPRVASSDSPKVVMVADLGSSTAAKTAVSGSQLAPDDPAPNLPAKTTDAQQSSSPATSALPRAAAASAQAQAPGPPATPATAPAPAQAVAPAPAPASTGQDTTAKTSDQTQQHFCPKSINAPFLWVGNPIVGATVVTGCAVHPRDFVMLSIFKPTG